MSRLRYIIPVLLGACILAAMMMTTPDFNSVFRPFRTDARDGSPDETLAQGRLFSARFTDWKTADKLAFERYGKAITRDTQGVFLVVDFELLNVRESVRLTATWLGRSGREYVQTTRAEGTPLTLDVRQFHPGIANKGSAYFELPPDEIQGGQLLVARRGPNTLDSELVLKPTSNAPVSHQEVLRIGK